MASNDKVPAVLKPINPFILRARELIRAGGDKVVAYHCFKHAMDLGLKLNDKSPECKAFLMELIKELETMNPSIQGKSQDELKTICENFAQNVFQRADAIDKAGNADKGTAQSYYAAATFFEILKQFSPDKELDPDIKQEVVYAKWRAAEIVRAIKEGRKPEPPNSSGDMPSYSEDHQDAHDTRDEQPHIPPAVQAPPPRNDIPIARPPAPGMAVPARVASYGQPVTALSKPKRADCLETLRFARAAIEADDIPAAIERLQAVLALLHEG